VRLVDDKRFDTYLSERATETDADEGALRALGLVTGSVDVDQAAALVSGGTATGVRYDPALRALVLRDRPLSPFARAQLVRELTRALDDAHFRIHRGAPATRHDESQLAFRALVDGDAARVERAFLA